MPLEVYPSLDLYGFQLACEQANPSGTDGNLPYTMSSSPAKLAASFGSEAHGSLGTCRAICSSSFVCGVGEAEAGAGAMGSLWQHLTFQG